MGAAQFQTFLHAAHVATKSLFVFENCIKKKTSFVLGTIQNISILCVCVCAVIPSNLDVRFVDVPAGVAQEEGRTGFLHLLSAVLALIFLARRIQPFLSLGDREVEFCVPGTNELIVLHLLGNVVCARYHCTCLYICMYVCRNKGAQYLNWSTGLPGYLNRRYHPKLELP